MKILIVGGAGFVGSNLAFYLKENGHEITVLDNLVRRGSENNILTFKERGISYYHGDIRNSEDLMLLPDVDVVLLCAAQPCAINYANPVFDITNNTIGVLNVLEWCRHRKAALIFWSTNKVYSGEVCNDIPYEIQNRRFVWNDPDFKRKGWDYKEGFSEELSIDGKDHSIYGLSKVCSDLMIQEWSDAFGIPSVINRFSCLAGPNQWGKAEQGWVSWFVLANEFNLPLTIYGYGGYQVRDYLFTPDINRLIEKQIHAVTSSDSKHKGSVYNVGGGHSYSVSLNEALDTLSNSRSWVDINFEENLRRADQAIYISNISKVCEEFNWEPEVSFVEGCFDIRRWIRTNKDLLEKLY